MGANPADTALRQQAAFGTLCELIMSFNGGANHVASAGARYGEYYRESSAASTAPLDGNRYFLSPSFRSKVITGLVSAQAARAYETTSSYQRARDAAAQSGGDPGVN